MTSVKVFKTLVVGKRLEVAHTTNRAMRRAEVKHWPARGGSLAARPKAPASLRTRLAVRNPVTGRLESYSYAEIAAAVKAAA